MFKCYYYPTLLILLTACGTKISYVGNSFPKTIDVGVFVDESAIKKNYEVVGKGFISRGYLFRTPEKIQEKAMAKARQKGADAILIKDYYIPNTYTGINTVLHSDSVGKGLVTIGNSTIQQSGTTGMTIYFLKYQ